MPTCLLSQGYTARACMWDNDLLLFPTDTGRLVWWNLDGQCVKEIKVLEQDYFVHIAWDELGKSLFVCGFSTLNHVTLTRSAPDGKEFTVRMNHLNHHFPTLLSITREAKET